MKKLAILSMVFISLHAYGQADTVRWCPPGATWVYSAFNPFNNSFYQFKYTKDSTVANVLCKKLEVTEADFLGPARHDYIVGAEYLYKSNDSVFYWNGGVFKFLYRFNMQLGDSWVIHKDARSQCNIANIPETDTFRVWSVSDGMFGGNTYRIFADTSVSKNFRFGSIIKNIGSFENPFPVISTLTCTNAMNPYASFFWGLRCYSDSVRGFVPFNQDGCENIITALPPPAPLKGQIFVYPNPSRSEIRFQTDWMNNPHYIIRDIKGVALSEGVVHDGRINIEFLPGGFYFITISDKKNSFTTKFIRL